MSKLQDKKFDFAYLIFTSITILFYVIMNIASMKQFSVFGLDFEAGKFFIPVTYVISSIVSEVYGYKHSRILSLIAAVGGIIMTFCLWFCTVIPSSYDTLIFDTFFQLTPMVSILSLFAYLVGDYTKDKIFEKMKLRNIGNLFCRVSISSFAGYVVDVILIAVPFSFISWGYTLKDMPSLFIGQIGIGSITSLAIDLCLFPVVYIASNKLLEKRSA